MKRSTAYSAYVFGQGLALAMDADAQKIRDIFRKKIDTGTKPSEAVYSIARSFGMREDDVERIVGYHH